jgi:hypothetical protein
MPPKRLGWVVLVAALVVVATPRQKQPRAAGLCTEARARFDEKPPSNK